MNAEELYGKRVVEDIFALRPSLRCSSCGEKGHAEVIPSYRKGSYAPSQAGYYMQKNVNCHDPEEEIDLYAVLDGDGINDVYLSDGIFVSSDGKLSDGN